MPKGENMEALLKKTIRDIPDFPKPGIIFKDITPILLDHELFAKVIATLAERYKSQGIKAVVGIESRGFIFGMPLAQKLKAAFIPIRKKGKLPYETVEETYNLEYGTATVEMHTDAIQPKQKVLIMDDLLATGGTAQAACNLVKKQGGKVVECAFVVELEFLEGRKKISAPVYSLVKY
ncbi:MAG: adenine phosphoribosyltransferase [Pseudomonadota bacterium]